MARDDWRNIQSLRNKWNSSRFCPDGKGHYESWFVRANHPHYPRAFWIRYTIFKPEGYDKPAEGEIWAIYFDRRSGDIVTVRNVFPMEQCRFSRHGLDIEIGDNLLSGKGLTGRVRQNGRSIEWELKFAGDKAPLFLLPTALYECSFPKAKALVVLPNAVFAGSIRINNTDVPVDGWRGSQNHNWGGSHTDRYAWGQTAGFDNAPDAFLECSTAKIKTGPLWSPWITLIVIRTGRREIAVNSILRGITTKAQIEDFHWRFDTRTPNMRICGQIYASRSLFAKLIYRNPPGGNKICLNTKIARCEVRIEERNKQPVELLSRHGTAFELLDDENSFFL